MDKKDFDPSTLKVLRELNGKAFRDIETEKTLKILFSGLISAALAAGFRYAVGQCETEFCQGLFTWPMWVHAITAGIYSARLFFRGALALIN